MSYGGLAEINKQTLLKALYKIFYQHASVQVILDGGELTAEQRQTGHVFRLCVQESLVSERGLH